jgi:hypothetical protein
MVGDLHAHALAGVAEGKGLVFPTRIVLSDRVDDSNATG